MKSTLINNFLIKFASLAVSLKVWLIVATTWLLLRKNIPAEVWERVILGIALGRVVVQSILAHTGKLGSMDLKKPQKSVKVDL